MAILGAGIYLGSEARAAKTDLESGCGDSDNLCSADEVDAVETKLVTADFVMGTGALGLAVGVALYFILGSENENSDTALTNIRLNGSVANGGGFAVLNGSF